MALTLSDQGEFRDPKTGLLRAVSRWQIVALSVNDGSTWSAHGTSLQQPPETRIVIEARSESPIRSSRNIACLLLD